MLKRISRIAIALFITGNLFIMPMTNAALAVVDYGAIAKLGEEIVKWEQQMDFWRQQLKQIDPTQTAALQSHFQQFRDLQQQLNGLMSNYEQLQQAWDGTFKDYSQWSGRTGQDYANDLNQVVEAMKQQQRDAIAAQGLVSSTDTDLQNLNDLLNANQGADGTVKVQQIGNQIAAMQIQQMIRLQQMMSQYNQAQLTYMRQLQQNDDRYKAAIQPLVSDTPDPAQLKQRGGVTP